MHLRTVSRLVHLVAAGWLGTFIYSPWSTDPTFLAATRLGLVPVLMATGLVLWKQAAVNRWLRAMGAGHGAH